MFPDYSNDSFTEQSNEVAPKRDVNIPQLMCMGKVSFAEDVFHSAGYVCSREFDYVLNNRDPFYSLHTEENVLLFNKCFIFEEAFFNDQELLFTLLKTTYSKIELAAKANQVHTTGTSPTVMRQNAVNFMSYLRVYTYRFLSEFGKDDELEVLYEKLTEIIEQTCLWLTCVSDMPSIVFSSGSLNNNSPIAVLFHTYFDIKWSLLEIAYMATNLRKYNENSRKSREKFMVILQQLEESLCGDLLYLAIRKFPEVSPNDWSGTSPFNCTCIRELWFMLLVILKSENSVYNFILKQYTNLLENPSPAGFFQNFSDTKRLKMPSKDPLALAWLFTHLSRLGGFSQIGNWDRNFSRIESNFDVINKLVQLYLMGTDAIVNEERTKGLVGCLYSLSQIWGSNLNLCIILWEYFNKKLDDSFTTTSSAFEQLPYSSSLSWYETLTSNVEPWKSLTTRHNSYFIFLRLLGHHMELLNTKSQASLKARLYVKLQGKKIQELSLLGLYHMISACLTIVLTSESSDDMCSKILEMSANHKQKFIFFVAEMVMLLICVSRGRDCQQVATSISSQMEKVSRSLKDGDLKVREEQRKYSAVFIENFQEVIFQSKNFSLGQKILIDKPLRSYLKSCGNCDRSVILDSLSNMFKKLRNTPDNCEEIYAAVMTHVYPLMKEKFASIEHISFFVELTTVALDTSRPEFQSIFTFLCLDDKVNPRLSLKYLSQLLETRQFLVNLSFSVDNYQTVLIQSWFRISFLLPTVAEWTDDFDRLNSIVKRLPRMAELTIQSNIQFNGTEMILEFLMMISANHQNIQNYSERAIVKETYLQYIGPLDKYLNSGFTGGFWEATDQVGHILRLGGQIYFHGGNIIYTKGKVDCLLAQLNNVLLIPINFSDVNKELPAAAISPLQQYLPSYIFGLFRLNPSRDPYVMRCLSTVFQTYMTRFPPNHSHPFTRCWIGLESEPISNTLVPIVRSWFLQTIASSVLPQKAAKTSPYLQPTLHWLKFLITNKDWKLEILKSILLPIFELSLILDEIVGKKTVTDFLQSAVSSPNAEQTAVMEQALNEFVGRHLAFNSSRLFKLMEVISFLNADLVRRTLPKLREQVAVTELKRGIGADSVLRQLLGTLELSLGQSRSN
ncbi:protein MMS22-like [Daphnia pulicaria]|uniref:protein MMS22-like n=1 Tax=Daphnia pulicaria TaxID=35523 RepID=UPI001EEBF893|nr:protein MMS22-like [Daphnia pulicaria]XP_046635827.1 protein MMS22-like [Daphnia pulicaria]XP_046635828.1 protein MMS22-like [Daphnia pulicaria]